MDIQVGGISLPCNDSLTHSSILWLLSPTALVRPHDQDQFITSRSLGKREKRIQDRFIHLLTVWPQSGPHHTHSHYTLFVGVINSNWASVICPPLVQFLPEEHGMDCLQEKVMLVRQSDNGQENFRSSIHLKRFPFHICYVISCDSHNLLRYADDWGK